MGRLDRSAEVWHKFLEDDGDPEAGNEALADLYLRLLDPVRAATHLKEAVRHRPTDKRLREKLEMVEEMARQKRPDGTGTE